MLTINIGVQGKTGDKNPEEDEDDDEKYKVFLFAPDDIPSQVTNPKDNYFGIGYTGLDRSSTAHVNLFDPPKLRVEGKKKAIVGQVCFTKLLLHFFTGFR